MNLQMWTENLEHAAVVVRVAGDLDTTTATHFNALAGELGLDAPARVVVDLTRVTFLDARGMAALVELANHVNNHGGRFALVTMPRGRRLLHVSRLDRFIAVFDTMNEGISWLTTDPA